MGGINLLRLRRNGDGFGDEGFDIVASPRLHLDRRVAQHICAPSLRGVGDQERGPRVRHARKVMIAMTTTRARPASESPG